MGPRKRQGPSLGNKEKRQRTGASKDARKDAKGINDSRQTGTGRAKPESGNATLYVQNLNDQISIGDLRVALYMLFSSFGSLVAINAHKSPKMRGQAHIVYSGVADAAKALTQLQGKQFLDKPLKIAYAKTESKRLALAKQ